MLFIFCIKSENLGICRFNESCYGYVDGDMRSERKREGGAVGIMSGGVSVGKTTAGKGIAFGTCISILDVGFPQVCFVVALSDQLSMHLHRLLESKKVGKKKNK